MSTRDAKNPRPSAAARAEAAAWVARLHGPNRTPEVEAGLRRWLADNPEHAEAFDDPEIARWLVPGPANGGSDSLFTTFAEIYIAFGNLERAVETALADNREKEAVDRLFGGKFDSLRRLVDKVTEEANSDIVRTYITLLNARQLLKELESNHAEFCHRHPTDVSELRSLIEQSSKIRNSFTFCTAEERDAFFRWYDRWFLEKARPIAEVKE